MRRAAVFCCIAATFFCNAAFAHVGAVVSLARFKDPPPLLTAPDGGVHDTSIPSADGSFDIAWDDGDADPTGRYYFYYLDHQPPPGLDTATLVKQATPIAEGSTGIWAACFCISNATITCPDAPDAGPRDCRNDFAWDTHALAPGAYWIVAVDNDPPYYLWSASESPVRVGHGGTTPPPGAIFIQPNGIGSADQSYTIEWVAAGDGPLTFDLAWGPDNEPAVEGAATSIAAQVNATDEGGGKFSYVWDTSQLATADIYVQLTVHDAGGRSTVTDSLNLKIFHPAEDAAVTHHPDLAVPRPTGGSCDTTPSDGSSATALFAGVVLALLLVLAARRSWS
jgi:hypothetical protein